MIVNAIFETSHYYTNNNVQNNLLENWRREQRIIDGNDLNHFCFTSLSSYTLQITFFCPFFYFYSLCSLPERVQS
jgi:hypothetical protein